VLFHRPPARTSDSFEQQIVIDAEAGSAPNIAVFPQPGLAADMAARGFLTPLGRHGTRMGQ
jgi:alpha-glucoside transport system substrate-binding protein